MPLSHNPITVIRYTLSRITSIAADLEGTLAGLRARDLAGTPVAHHLAIALREVETARMQARSFLGTALP